MTEKTSQKLQQKREKMHEAPHDGRYLSPQRNSQLAVKISAAKMLPGRGGSIGGSVCAARYFCGGFAHKWVAFYLLLKCHLRIANLWVHLNIPLSFTRCEVADLPQRKIVENLLRIVKVFELPPPPQPTHTRPCEGPCTQYSGATSRITLDGVKQCYASEMPNVQDLAWLCCPPPPPHPHGSGTDC